MSEHAHGRRRWLGDFPLNRPGHHGLSGPLYPKLLRLKHLHPSAWQRAALVEGSVAVGAVAALADQVTAWTPLVLPVAVAVVVKFHDVLTGILRPAAPAAVAPAAVAPAAVAPPPPVAADVRRTRPVLAHPLLVPPTRARAELDLLTAVALGRAIGELGRRGGLDTFALRLDESGAVSAVPVGEGLGALASEAAVHAALHRLTAVDDPSLRAVVLVRDVGLPGKPARDAVRLDFEHVDGRLEQVTATYRWTGVGGQVVVGEQTRSARRRTRGAGLALGR